MDHSGRIAVVTGAARGIGFEVSRRLAAAGAQVALLDQNQELVTLAAESLQRAGHGAECFQVDVADPGGVKATFTRILELWERIDILVNNAGISIKQDGQKVALEYVEFDQWERVIAVNLTGAFLCSKYAVPAMRRLGWGRIVSLSSQGGRGPGLFSSADYGASKAGIGGLTRTLALEVGRFGITVNAVAPGRIQTPMTSLPQELASSDAYVAQLPVPRAGTVDEVAATILFLTSDEAGYITGATIDVNGGGYMS